MIKKVAAILLGKSIHKLTRNLKIGGGSAAPGLYALKIDPQLIEKLITNIPKNIIITGTNGKTTTARLLSHFAKANGLKVIRNQTGSNLERGIASALIHNTDLAGLMRGTCEVSLGIWEVDEAAFNTVAPKIKPDIIIFLNAFRDQLDRYGEVDTVVKKWQNTLDKLNKKTLVLINGDDGNTIRLKNSFKGQILTFGVKDFKIAGERIQRTTRILDFEAKIIAQKALEGIEFETILHKKPYKTYLPLPGVYNIYNFLAAFAAGYEMDFSTNSMLSSLKSFSPAFGRVEKFTFKPQGFKPVDGYIFLIKNPTGANQVFKTIVPVLKQEDSLFLALNDNLADGKDVSWIWDADFEQLSLQTKCGNLFFVSGSRAYDMALRLKYAGFDPANIKVEENLENAFKKAAKGLTGRLFIFPTYTAMLVLQKILTKQGIKKNYWKESD